MNDRQKLQRARVAPYHPNPQWPTGYFQALEEVGVEEPRRRFYAHWVRQFFNRHQGRKRRRDLGRVEIEAFLQALAADDGVVDWQVVQAGDALEIYYQQFRGIALEPGQTMHAKAETEPERLTTAKKRGQKHVSNRSDTSRPEARIPTPRVLDQPSSVPKPQRQSSAQKVNWGTLEKAIRAALRTDHYALKTEKAYVQWIRRFVVYHHEKRPSSMGGAQIHQFLSHLEDEEGRP